jgi:hypothetical protein
MAIVDELVDRAAQLLGQPSPGSRFVGDMPTAGLSLLYHLQVGRRHNGAGAGVADERLRRALQRVADATSGAAAERRIKLGLATTPNPSRRYLILDSEEISRFHDQRISRRSGIRFADKDMRQHWNLRRFPFIWDHRVIPYERKTL